MPPVIIVVTLSGALAFFFLALALLPRSTGIDRRLADLEHSSIGREAQNGFFAKLIDQQQRSQIELKLAAAGWYKVTPTQMVARTVVCGVIASAAAVALVVFVGTMSVMWLGGAAAMMFAGFAAPTAMLNRAAEARQKAVQRALPDFLDMLTATVEAGVSLNGALIATVEAISGPLADELESTISEIRLGRSRADALTALADRVQQPDLSTAVIAIVQAERLGGDVVNVLTEISTEARESRMMRIEELAAQLPVKMVFPMTLFILPALVVMIFGPVVASVLAPK